MEFTEHFGLACPSPTDYAALPLYMQRLAEQIEDAVIEQQAQISAFQRPPTSIWKNDTNLGPISNTGFLQLTFGPAQRVFANYGGASQSLGPFTGTFPSAGLYHLGWATNAREVGAVNADTFRQMRFWVQKQTAGGLVDVMTAHRVVYATAAGFGEYFGADNTVLIDDEFSQYIVRMEFTHGNTSSQVQLTINETFVWLTRIGSSDAIEVA